MCELHAVAALHMLNALAACSLPATLPLRTGSLQLPAQHSHSPSRPYAPGSARQHLPPKLAHCCHLCPRPFADNGWVDEDADFFKNVGKMFGGGKKKKDDGLGKKK